MVAMKIRRRAHRHPEHVLREIDAGLRRIDALLQRAVEAVQPIRRDG